ncbi:MAG: hypothetical protein ACREOK_05680 [Gemmatimonadaceae bacterium]
MIFAYNEDGTLEVVADVTEARGRFESSDVESGAVRLFDSRGKPLQPHFPNRTEKKFLGMRMSSDPGPYELAPATGDGEMLEQALGPTVVLMPNRWFPSLDAVHAHFARTR